MISSGDIKLRFISSLNLSTQHHTLLRDDDLGIQAEKISNKTDGGYGIRKTKSFYFIDNDPREFLDIESLVDAYNEKFQFEEENPEHEVKFIKVVVKRQIDNPIQ